MKKIILLLAIFTLIFSGCSSTNQDEINSLKKQLADLQKSITTPIPSSIPSSLPSELPSASPSQNIIDGSGNAMKKILKEKVYVKDYCQFQITKLYFSKTIKPSNPESYYTYYSAKVKSETYFDAVINVKNLTKDNIDLGDIIDVTLYYDSGFEYSTFAVSEEDGNLDTFASIDPLQTKKAHFLTVVPLEVQNSKKQLYIIIETSNTSYLCVIRG